MIREITAYAVIILSLYIIISFLMSSRDAPALSSPYHLGCYEASTPMNHSKQMTLYLQNLSATLAPYSVSEVNRYTNLSSQLKISENGANAIASEFKKYIIAYENIKNQNEYEQSYNKLLREAHNDFKSCRDKFLENDWNCNNTYQRYLKADMSLNGVKKHLTDLISDKFEEQAKIEKLLAPEGSSQPDNQTYHKVMQHLNKQHSRLVQQLKQKNESLMALQTQQMKEIHDLNLMKQLVKECKQSKNEIQICKTINNEISGMFDGLDPRELQKQIKDKQFIIEKYQRALAKSTRIGLDSTQIRQAIAKNKKELNGLLQMYAEVETGSLCSNDLINKCSDQQIINLDRNITKTELRLQANKELKINLKQTINKGKGFLQEIEEKKKQATADYQNTIGSLDKIKELQALNLQKLKQHRENINRYNKQIESMQKDIESSQSQRKEAIAALDGVLKRVGELTGCLSKKDYLLQLQQKRPKRKVDDSKLKREAAETLIRVIKSVNN